MAQRISTVANVGRLAAGRDMVIAAAPNRRSRSRYSLLIATTLHDSRFVGRMHDGWGRNECSGVCGPADRHAPIGHRGKRASDQAGALGLSTAC